MNVPELTPELLAMLPAPALELIRHLLTRLDELEQQNTTLKQRVSELEAQLQQNSQNSSRPPSSDPPRVKRAPPRTPSGKKPGGQPGHRRQTRPLVPTAQCTRVLPCFPSLCRGCQRPLTGQDTTPQRYQVTELPPLQADVTEYQLHRLLCSCGLTTCGSLPSGVAGQDGPRLQAFVTLLTGQYRLSKDNAAALVQDLFGFALSAGQVCAHEAAVGELLDPVVADLRATVRQHAANIDETGLGPSRWLWVMVTALGTVFQIALGRNREKLLELVGPNYQRVITSDRHSVYGYLPPERHQFCWAHLRRDFQAMVDRKNVGSVVGQELLALSDELFDWWYRVRDGTLTRAGFATKMHADYDFRSRFRAALQRGVACGCTKTRGTCRELAAQEVSLFLFAFVSGVEPTNNAAEQALRHGVLWRKQSYGPKSAAGARYLANIWSVVATCRQQQRHVWEFLRTCIMAAQHGHTLPKLTQPQAA